MGDPPSRKMKVVLAVVALAVIVSATDDNVATKVACPDGNCGQPTQYVKVQGQAAQKIAKTIAPDVQTQHAVKDPAAADQIIKNIKKKPCKKKEVTQQVVRQQVQTPVQVVKETVPAKVGPFIKIVKETPIVPAPVVKKVYVPKPVPVPAPAPQKKDGCSVDVSECFAARPALAAPVWQSPVDNFASSFSEMCGPEIKAKAAAKETKSKAEMKTKELCSKNEGNQKYAEKKLKLAAKKESYSKAVAEGREKFLEKKVKSAEEATAKQIGMTKEKATKSAEAANKREDELYKKECVSKETAFKAVREGKQKVKVVYVNAMPSLPAPAPAPAPVPVVVPSKKIVKTVTYKPVPTPPVAVHKTVVYVPAPQTVTKVVVHHDDHSELQVKQKESMVKMNAKSAEVVEKANLSSQEAVDKEAAHKHGHVVVIKKSNEGACKEKESKEFARKSEIQTKLAVEKVRKELATKEVKSKVVVPVKKPCNPESSLEAYVKHCKGSEEKYEKAKFSGEKNIKEAKAKAKASYVETECKLARQICRRIYKDSSIRDGKIVEMVADHPKQLEIAMAKAQAFEAKKASKIKFDICKSAAEDMQYFAHNFLFSSQTGADALK